MYRVKIYLGSSLFSFYQGMVRTMKMSFYKRKIYLDQCHFAYSTESFRFRTENCRMWSFYLNKLIIFSTNYWLIVAYEKESFLQTLYSSFDIHKWHHNSKKFLS